MSRVYNFSAGPAVLPEEVLKEAAEEMLDYRGTGMSVMEMSHRSKPFEEIIQTAEKDLRDPLRNEMGRRETAGIDPRPRNESAARFRSGDPGHHLSGNIG